MMKPIVVVFAAALLAGCASNQPVGPYNAAERAYCDALARQYDRYFIRGDGGTSMGTLDRAAGQQLCAENNYVEGQERLLRAVRAIGFDPVQRGE